MELFDTHAHLNDERFSEDLEEVLTRARSAGISRILLASTDFDDCRTSLQIARERSQAELVLQCSVGIHPHHATGYTPEIHSQMIAWLENRTENRIVAIGEIGLDYFYEYSPREIQKEVFIRQLTLSREMDIPVIIHEREATADMLTILTRFFQEGKLRAIPGVCHCFSGSAETAQILLGMGFYLGFDGPITFKNNRKAKEVISSVPADRLLIETDCPYLTPEPFRGKRNEPAYLPYVLETIAEMKQIPVEDMAKITSTNAKNLFCE
jgi:TatD DNase family protein